MNAPRGPLFSRILAPAPGDAAAPPTPADPNGHRRGTVLIFLSVAIASCVAFAVLTLDIGMIVMTKGQLQNAADAAALAGASVLATGDQDEARRLAIAVAGENRAWRVGMDPVVITNEDVTFPTTTSCRVVTHRTRATGDALRTFFIRAIDPSADRFAEASAMAEAELFDICGAQCVKPWSVPDQWDDVDGDGEFDYAEEYTDSNGNEQHDPGEPFTDKNGNGAWDPDEPYDPVTTGYLVPQDLGLRVNLKVGSSNDTIVPSFFYAVDLPTLHSPDGDPITGASQYQDWIAGCPPYTVELGDSLQVEPGNMVGPTSHGTQDLIAQDPGAYWNPTTKSIEGSAYGTSPRVVKVAFFNPLYTPKSGRNFVIVSKLGAFFVESEHNGEVTGVFMGATTKGKPCDGDEPSFLSGLRLTE